jgi:NTP pyrophosphatase (non-canonical NTP hydrolase)
MKELNNINKELLIEDGINYLVEKCFNASHDAGWWSDLSGAPKERNQGEMLMLIVSEIAEAMEACRRNLASDKLPDYLGVEEELADAVIRIADFCGGFDLDLSGAILDKLEYNANRADHKVANRAAEGGKKW